MECNVREISNAVMIDSLNTIIKQESQKLELDKNTGLLSKKFKLLNTQESVKENENTNTLNENIPLFKNLKNKLPKTSHLPIIDHSHDRVNEIERLANLFTQSPSFFTTNNINNHNSNIIHVKQSHPSNKEIVATQTHNKFDNYKVLLNYNNNEHLITPDIKVKRNVRFGEYSPLNPTNQVNSQPFLGIGEYDDKKKKLLEAQRKEYIEYLSKTKQEKNTSDLPKLVGYSCEEAFKTAMEGNCLEQIKLNNKDKYRQEHLVELVPIINRVESCAFDDEEKKEANRLKQELYRTELNRQIEEKKRLELERKRKEQMDDEAIEKAARDKEEKIKKDFEKEVEKRTLAKLQKQFQQEKLKNELMRKQKELEIKSSNVQAKNIFRQVSKHVPSCHQTFEDDYVEEFRCPPESTFDNVPLPTTRIRVPRKIVYEEENACIKQNTSPPVMRKNVERTHVSFAKEPSLKRSEHNSAVMLPTTKSMIIDSPLTLALAGLDDRKEEDKTCGAIEPTEAANRNQISKEALLGNNHELLTDKHLLSNLGNIRKQLGIEHQKLKQQVRRSQ